MRVPLKLRDQAWFCGFASVCVLAFGWFVTQGTGDIFATEPFTDLFDAQARSILHGRLDVPFEVVSLETFVVDSHCYTYFGLTPALLRIPFVLAGVPPGHLSRCFMLGYFAAALVASYLILLHFVRSVRGADAVPRRWSVVVLVANVGLGSTLFFLGTRSYVYHEAILCGVMFALWSIWYTLRFYATPSGYLWVGAWVMGVLAVHARPPAGLLAFGILGLAAGLMAVRTRATHSYLAAAKSIVWSRFALIALAAASGVISFNAVGYLKFRSFSGCPLALHVQYTPKRLARTDGGKLFFLQNIPFSTACYFLGAPPAISTEFPYVRIDEAPSARHADAKIDLAEPVTGIPFAMPGLFLLSGIGFAFAFASAGSARQPLLLLTVGGLPMILAMLAAVAVSHRYTADFCPLLICWSAIGVVALESLRGMTAKTVYTLVGAVSVVSLLVNLAFALQYQGELVWGVPDAVRLRYAMLRQRVDRHFGVVCGYGYDPNTLYITSVDARLMLFIPRNLAPNPKVAPRALAMCRGLVADHPNHAAINIAAAELLAQFAEAQPEALVCGKRALMASPSNMDYRIRYGDLLVNLGQPAAAVPYLEFAVRRKPWLARAHNDLGVAYVLAARNEDAIREFQIALMIDPNLADTAKSLELAKGQISGAPKAP